ncbi:hypothetical protein A1O1_04026 [Capronia coronata CBS 617.96]|uniref:Uncharacterized protein n=1 Tax=Capronia coronata CBS 617.96 TaxID=1182541 RepID=W9YMN5_9EURO|nr:uncharacterized protein A1O1_04026 [Capronia coronata CBS 617.96]EXJ90920.1 hypothetical protein A1O1_04026 [Capronia coronata CBS 617.96]
MSTRSLRHRSSRLSSPATFGEKETVPKPVEAPLTRNGQQTSLDTWIEPAVRPAVPSFEDTRGLERAGVLENMQPLGTAPSSRLLQKLKLNYIRRPSPRATPAQPEEDVTPAAEPEKMQLASPMESEIMSDHPPEVPPQAETIVISSPPRGRPPRREVAEMHEAATMSPSPVKMAFTPTSQGSGSKPVSIQEHLRQDRLRTHIDRAMQEAQQNGKPDLVPGLQRLREDACVMPELWNVLEAVVQESPSPDQVKTFKRYIKHGIKSHRRSSQFSASPYQSSPQHLGEFGLRDQPPYSNIDSTASPGQHRRQISLFINGSQIRGSDRPFEQPVSPSATSRSMAAVNAHERSSLHAHTTSPQKRKRTRSVSTSSSLSSAKSLPLPDEFGAPLDRAQRGEGRTGSRRSRHAGPRQASTRTAAGNRLRSVASASASATNPPSTSSKHAVDSDTATATATASKAGSKKLKRSREGESDYDIDELAKRKRHFLDDSFHDYNTIPRPESHEREPVHAHPNRADPIDNPPKPVIHPNRLMAPHAELSSPVSADAPQDRGLPNGTSRKRAYDEVDADEIDVITPDSSSPGPLLGPPAPTGAAAASSRGVTPRATRLPPAAKARRSARVMVS